VVPLRPSQDDIGALVEGMAELQMSVGFQFVDMRGIVRVSERKKHQAAELQMSAGSQFVSMPGVVRVS